MQCTAACSGCLVRLGPECPDVMRQGIPHLLRQTRRNMPSRSGSDPLKRHREGASWHAETTAWNVELAAELRPPELAVDPVLAHHHLHAIVQRYGATELTPAHVTAVTLATSVSITLYQDSLIRTDAPNCAVRWT